jgi:hypothetical protein
MDCSKMFIGRRDNAAAIFHNGKVSLYKVDLAGIGTEIIRNSFAALPVSPTDDQPCCTALFEHARDGLAQPL